MTVSSATFPHSPPVTTSSAWASPLTRRAARVTAPRTTYVRVADVDAAPGSRIVDSVCRRRDPNRRNARRPGPRPCNASARCCRWRQGKPVSGYSLADLELLAAQERITLRDLLEQLRAAGLELVAEAPFDRLRDPKRSIEEVNIAGMRLARLTIHQLPTTTSKVCTSKSRPLQDDVAVIPGFAPLAAEDESGRSDHGL